MNSLSMRYSLTLLILFACFSPITAQRNAPVFGDAATLVDLLRKDYRQMPRDERLRELTKDQNVVILILKGYLDENMLSKSWNCNLASYQCRIITSSEELKIVKLKSQIDALKNSKYAGSSTNLFESKLVDKIDTFTQDDENFILKRMCFNDSILNCIRSVYINNENNVYIDTLINRFINKYKSYREGDGDRFSRTNYSSSVQKALPFFGGDLALETVVEGLSQFLADRIKEELTTHVISKVKDWLNESRQDGIEELKILMPRTRDYILAFKASQVTHFPSEIKQYIEDDLNHLLENAGNLRNTARMKQLVKDHPTVAYALEAVDLIPQLSGLKDPVDFFDVLDNSPTIAKWRQSGTEKEKNAAASIDLCGLMVRSLAVNVNGQVRFVGADVWNAYKGEELFLKTYIGLLLQQDRKYTKVQFIGPKYPGDTIKLDTLITKLMALPPARAIEADRAHQQFRRAIDRISAHAQTIQTSAEQIRKASKLDRRVGPDTTYRFVGAVIDFTEELAVAGDSVISGLYRAFDPIQTTFRTDTISIARMHVSQYCSVARNCNEIVLDLRQKNYAIAIIKALELTKRIQPREGLENAAQVLTDLDLMWDQQKARDWNKLRKTFRKPGALSSDRRLRRSVERLEQDILGISELVEADRSLVQPGMDALVTALPKLKRTGRPIASTAKDSVNAIFLHDQFKDVLFEFYSRHKRAELEGLVRQVNQSTVGNQVRLIAQGMYDKDFRKQARENIEILAEVIGKDLNAVIQRTDAGLDPKLVRLVHFVNDMAKAETPDDVNAALEAFALPAGSYAIKREAVFNVSLNSYPGLLGGGTFPVQGEGAWALGFTAPVGLSFTWGIPPGKKGRSGHSIGLYLPVIDIGALTRLQFDDDPNTEYLPELSFHNIAAPGAYLHFGFRNTPLSLNLGGQYGPRMRYADGEVVEERDAWRFGLGLVLDIPIATLHNKPMIR